MSKIRDTMSLAEAIEGEGGAIAHMPLDDIKEYLERYGFTYLPDESSQNGWQVDFWEYFTHPEKGKWCLSGSLWYDDYQLVKQKS